MLAVVRFEFRVEPVAIPGPALMIRLLNQDALGRRPDTDAAGASTTAHVVRGTTTELNRRLCLAP